MFKDKLKKVVKKYQEYEQKAPERKKAEIEKLKQDIKLAKLKQQLNKVQNNNKPKEPYFWQ
jgi:hypothetical protein